MLALKSSKTFLKMFKSGYLRQLESLVLNPVSTRRRFDVYTTSITLKQRCMDVKTTRAYWEGVQIVFDWENSKHQTID